MYTSLAIQNYFDVTTDVFKDYNFINKYIYDSKMDFNKLKPFLLNQKEQIRKDNWMGIIYTRGAVQRGGTYYRNFKMYDPEKAKEEPRNVQVYNCRQSSCEVSYNIVSNSIMHLEALENELANKYDGRVGMTIKLPLLPEYELDVSDITYGEFTKYDPNEYGEICSLGMSVVLNYPILVKLEKSKLVERIKYIIEKGTPKGELFYETTLPQ